VDTAPRVENFVESPSPRCGVPITRPAQQPRSVSLGPGSLPGAALHGETVRVQATKHIPERRRNVVSLGAAGR